MGNPIDFDQANQTLGAPPNLPEAKPLRVYSDGKRCVSCWELSDEEIAEITRTKRIYCSSWTGLSQPAVFIASESETFPPIDYFIVKVKMPVTMPHATIENEDKSVVAPIRMSEDLLKASRGREIWYGWAYWADDQLYLDTTKEQPDDQEW